jgi:hypothetical protein
MIFKLFKQILWNEGFYIAITVISVLSTIVSLFIDINAMISIKWLLFCIWLSLTVGIILMKIILAIATFKKYPGETKIIDYIANKQILIIKTDMNLSSESFLSIYKNKSGYEEPIAIGYVLNIQENGMIQIQIIKFINKEDEKLSPKIRNTLIFKTVLSRRYVNIEVIE